MLLHRIFGKLRETELCILKGVGEMPSQFFGLYIAGSGLRAANAALNTTANNISNAQTVGYSRQQVTQQANLALRTFTTYGCAGAGVDTIAIERVRDSFYDVKYWDNNCKYGEFSVKKYYTGMFEDYFDDEGTSGFTAIFNHFSNCLQSLTTNSSSDKAKQQFIASAKSLTDYFNNMYGSLQELQKDINLEIKQNIEEINSLAQKISTLNKQINTIELSGARANELRDQRDLLIDELSEIVDVEINEIPILDANDPKRDTGINRYMVRIAGGQLLVDGTDFNTLSYVARQKDEKVNQSDVDGLYRFTWDNGNEFSLSNAAMGGKLKGLVDIRDGNNGANFTGKVETVTVPANPTAPGAQTEVTVKVEEAYLKTMQDCTLPEKGTINIGNALCSYESWTFDEKNGTYTFVLNSNEHPNIDAKMVGKEAKTEKKIKYQGIPYYMEQMNAWIRGFAEKVNDIFTSGFNAKGEAGCIFFTGISGNGTEYKAENFNDANGYYELTAGNFTINSDLILDANLLGTKSTADIGVEECGQVKELIALLTNKKTFSFRNGTAGQLLEAILSDVALNASDANMFYDTYDCLKNSIDNQRNSISSVDEDEEAVSMVKFQYSYTLASKMIQTLTEVYDQLILRTGV